ncbi:MAG: universal stress protein [Cyanobacteria bacterium P01_A01_bin.135]
MVKMKRILLADSGTGQTEEMLKFLRDSPLFQQAAITVLHVIAPQVTAQAMTTQWKDGGEILARAIQNLDLDPSQSTAMLREGDPKDVVCRVAEEIDADLIIMGSRGLKRLESILQNSVSQYVFQLASRPMLLVKDDIYAKKVRRILVTLDPDNTPDFVLEFALAAIQDISGGELIFVRVDPDLKTVPSAPDIKPEKDPILAPAVAAAQQRGVKYRCEAPVGKPGARICELAKDLDVDLLIIGSPERRPSVARGLPDLDRLLGQSLSDYVRVYAPCPVLLARRPE